LLGELGLPDGGAETDSRSLGWRDTGGVARHGPAAALDQSGDLDAGQRSRNHSEVRQRAEPPADVRRVLEHALKAALARECRERRSRIGDSHEAIRSRALRPEVFEVSARFDSRARLGRDDEHGVVEVERRRKARDVVGSVVSHTVSGIPPPRADRNVCGASDDPPIPHSTMCWTSPPARALRANS